MPEPDHLAAMMDHLAECAASNTRPLIDGEDGRNDMKVIEAICESCRTGRTVKLAWTPAASCRPPSCFGPGQTCPRRPTPGLP